MRYVVRKSMADSICLQGILNGSHSHVVNTHYDGGEGVSASFATPLGAPGHRVDDRRRSVSPGTN